MQVVNVALGGTLVQDIPSQCADALAHDGGARDARVHLAAVRPDSRLAAALGTTTLRVNSSHHQALERLGDAIRVTATAPDGIVEGAESTDDWWMLAVQWHPEELVATREPWDRELFRTFAARMRNGA
jgi:putative glutamine amidotransferase